MVHPLTVVEIPLDGFLDSDGEWSFGIPTELACYFAGVDCIAHIMTRAVGDKSDKVVIDILDRNR